MLLPKRDDLLLKIMSFHYKVKRQLSEWEKIIINKTTDKN